MAENNQHHITLNKICRVCGSYLHAKKQCHVENLKENLQQAFFLDTSKDLPGVHPKFVCLKCASLAKNVIARKSTPRVEICKWIPHSKDCSVCNITFLSGKSVKKRKLGRPPVHSTNMVKKIDRKIYNSRCCAIPL